MGGLLWIPVSLFAGITQLWRNGLQADLTERIGTVGATQVRFLYGFPFALVFLGIAAWLGGRAPALADSGQALWIVGGAIAQIGATALMLLAMRMRSFALGYVYIKTEPVLIALAGTFLLGDHLSPLGWAGILLATCGVVLAALKGRSLGFLLEEVRPALAGIGSGALFGLSAVLFRGAILQSPQPGFVLNALTVLCATLAVQSALLFAYLLIFDRPALTGSLAAWRRSFGAGGLGALSSAAWFIAFAMTAAANVRTVGLIEMPAAALLNRRISGEPLRRSEWLALVLVIVGVGLVLQQAIVAHSTG